MGYGQNSNNQNNSSSQNAGIPGVLIPLCRLDEVNKHLNDPFINPHQVNPNYLKLTEAEENFNKQNDN